MLTKDGIKNCKNCNGKGHVKGKPCELCCTHEGLPIQDPKGTEKVFCAQGCGVEMKPEKALAGASTETPRERKNRLDRERRAAKKAEKK